jgi:hypothetical protein
VIAKTSLDWLSERNLTYHYNISRLTGFGIGIVVVVAAEGLAHSVECLPLTLLILGKNSPDT